MLQTILTGSRFALDISGHGMPIGALRPDVTSKPIASELRAAVATVHEHCSIFTRPEVARIMLDMAGWKSVASLGDARLLEPACGEAVFLVAAARRLVKAIRRAGRDLDETVLGDRIVAFEFDGGTADQARVAVRRALRDEGIGVKLSTRLADKWIRCEDFLLSEHATNFSHIVGNPPYMRWSFVPIALREAYELGLPDYVAKGDLCLPFIWRATELVRPGGQVVFLCADRWLRSAYGEEARAQLSPRVRIDAHIEVHGSHAFSTERDVSAYAAITSIRASAATETAPVLGEANTIEDLRRLSKRVRKSTGRTTGKWSGEIGGILPTKGGAHLSSSGAVSALQEVIASFPTLLDAGVKVRCGLALGLAEAFIVNMDVNLERDRLVPFIRSNDIASDGTARASSCIVNPWSSDGRLVDLARFPRLNSHLTPYKDQLLKRACVRTPSEWFRTIDRIDPVRLAQPKILIAGMALRARVAFDPGGAQPSNALYSMQSDEWPLDPLFAFLRSGALDLFAEVLSPRFSGGSKRFDGYVLRQLRLPRWGDVKESIRKKLNDIGRYGPANLRPQLIAEVYRLKQRRHVLALDRAFRKI